MIAPDKLKPDDNVTITQQFWKEPPEKKATGVGAEKRKKRRNFGMTLTQRLQECLKMFILKILIIS